MKKGNNSKMGNGIYFKIAGWVDLEYFHLISQKLLEIEGKFKL
jgi:hypothetical protein